MSFGAPPTLTPSAGAHDTNPLNLIRLALAAIENLAPAEAIEHAERALALHPDMPEAVHVLGLAAAQMGSPIEAIELLKHAQRLAPDLREPVEMLAILYARLGRVHDGLYHAKLSITLKPHPALDNLIPALFGTYARHLNSVSAPPLIERGNVLFAKGRYAEAAEMYQQQLALDPTDTIVLRRCTESLFRSGQFQRALGVYDSLRHLEPSNVDDLSALASTLHALGRFDQALVCHQRAVAQAPERADLHSRMLFELSQFPTTSRQTLAAEHKRWRERHVGAPAHPLPAARHGRRIRVAYLSGAFRDGTELTPLLPTIAAHDRSRFEVICYSNTPVEDPRTRALRNAVEKWFDIRDLDDETAKVLMRNEELDVLIDLDGHRGGGRAALAAAGVAPVVLSLFGLPETLGDPRHTAALGDEWTYPDDNSSAPVARVADGIFALPAEASPVDRSGEPQRPAIFGTLGWRSDANATTVDVWARVLELCADSLLVVDPARMGGPAGLEEIVEQFAHFGLARRVMTLGETDADDYDIGFLKSIDILLDAFPVPSCSVAIAALLQGVPVVTLAGPLPLSRTTASLLSGFGLGELVAENVEQYVQIATRLATEPDHLAAIRKRVAERLRIAAKAGPIARARALEETLLSHLDRIGAN